MTSKWPSNEKIEEVLEIVKNADASRPLPKGADAVDRLKHRLCREVLMFKHTRELSNEDMAKMLDVDKSEVSKIINYHIDRYTIDRLYRLTLKLLPDLQIDFAA